MVKISNGIDLITRILDKLHHYFFSCAQAFCYRPKGFSLKYDRIFYLKFAVNIFILLDVLSLAGCSILSPVKNPPIKTYVLSCYPHTCRDEEPHPITLLVSEPQSSPTYNTTLMAYTVKPFEISYFAYNRWVESPPLMLKSLMVTSLQNTHYFRAVVPAPFVGKFDYVLNTQLIKLQQNFTTRGSSVEIIMRAQLINAVTSQVVAARQFCVTKNAACCPYGGVIAANIATQSIMRQLVEFTLYALDTR